MPRQYTHHKCWPIRKTLSANNVIAQVSDKHIHQMLTLIESESSMSRDAQRETIIKKKIVSTLK